MLKIIYALYHVYYHFESGMKIITDYSKLIFWFLYSGSANSGPNACNCSHPAQFVKDVFDILVSISTESLFLTLAGCLFTNAKPFQDQTLNCYY